MGILNPTCRAASSWVQLIKGSAIFGATFNVLYPRAGSPAHLYSKKDNGKIISSCYSQNISVFCVGIKLGVTSSNTPKVHFASKKITVIGFVSLTNLFFRM
jgi:hypothetical protein